MRDNLRNKFGVFLICLTAVLGVDVSYAGCGQNINEGIQKIIDEERVKYHIPGIEVSISCPGEDSPRDFVSGTTTLNGDVPIRPEHLFQIGSETKSFISAVILQLEAEGRLSIYDPIGNYLKNIPEAWQDVTIQQLLNHTSGIFNYTEVVELWTALMTSDFKMQFSSDELISFVKNKEFNFFPGLGWSYSNTNYILAGMVVQAVTGKSIEEEINTRLLQPLHLSNTYYYAGAYNDDMLQRMAHGYSSIGLFPDEPKDITSQNMSWANAAGAIVSTSHDIAIWLRHLLTDDNLLSANQRQELLSLVDVENGQPLPFESDKVGYGLGVIRFNLPSGEIWGHDGGTFGFISHMSWLKCNDVVITAIVNHVDKSEADGLGSTAITMDLINFIQQADTTKQCQMGLMPSKRSLSKQLQSIRSLDRLVPKRSQ
ncbi:TPA: beta-lactamase family protein [Legionella pneumophila]|uniref:D-stereospecific peptide hydrolase (Modular protein) n=1 Tax=Legionella fallonii LLAP-10 TaxID=1212491 RepID=A0A098G9X6_9GAMM|nr:D-stereospecific peptide hydrolase (modular protein) [Legionella fallonii LLAP-10]HAU3668147.1 beta-lactamase family protein [Legionella pneumophila]